MIAAAAEEEEDQVVVGIAAGCYCSSHVQAGHLEAEHSSAVSEDSEPD